MASKTPPGRPNIGRKCCTVVDFGGFRLFRKCPRKDGKMDPQGPPKRGQNGYKMGPKRVPRGTQNGLRKKASKRTPKETPKWPQRGPRWPQMGPKRGPRWAPKGAREGPKGGPERKPKKDFQMAPNMAPKCPPRGPKMGQIWVLGRSRGRRNQTTKWLFDSGAVSGRLGSYLVVWEGQRWFPRSVNDSSKFGHLVILGRVF